MFRIFNIVSRLFQSLTARLAAPSGEHRKKLDQNRLEFFTPNGIEQKITSDCLFQEY